jgi:ribosomal protein S18 acetylase RimI-like enzyme
MLIQSRRGSSAAAFCYVFLLCEFSMQCAAGERNAAKHNATKRMQPSEFAAYHLPALERDEAKHNLIIAVLGRLTSENPPELEWWSLGEPGQCAIKAPGYPMVLGDLNVAQCHAFAEAIRSLDYPAVVGADETPRWFVERAGELGVTFLESIPQQIQVLRDKPAYPAVPGHARQLAAADTPLFSDWMVAFVREAIPQDPVPTPEQLALSAASGRFQFWIVDGEPVSMAGIMRRTRHAAAIAGVYTPPRLRGRGYAGSVTAAVADAIFAEGRSMACLYVDLRNPYSSRCYAKIGFTPVCRSWYCPRVSGLASGLSAKV